MIWRRKLQFKRQQIKNTQEDRTFIYLFTSYTSKHLAKEAINFALKSTPIKQAIPATNAAKTAAYLHKKKLSVTLKKQHKKAQEERHQEQPPGNFT